MKSFHAYALTQFEVRIKAFRSDNGHEFKLNEFFSENGIIHQKSCVNTPQQNAIVERKHQHILNVARSLRFQAHLPLECWGHCVMHAVYIINRLPSPVISWWQLKQCMDVSLPNIPTSLELDTIMQQNHADHEPQQSDNLITEPDTPPMPSINDLDNGQENSAAQPLNSATNRVQSRLIGCPRGANQRDFGARKGLRNIRILEPENDPGSDPVKLLKDNITFSRFGKESKKSKMTPKTLALKETKLLLRLKQILWIEWRGNEGRRFTSQQRPIHALEEPMVFHRRGSHRGPQPTRRIFDQQLRYQVFRGGGHGGLPRELQRPDHNIGPRMLVVHSFERRHAVEQLENEDPQRPPIHGVAVAFAGDHLRRQVLVGPHERHRPDVHGLRHHPRRPRVAAPAAAVRPPVLLALAVEAEAGHRRSHAVGEFGRVVAEVLALRRRVRRDLAGDYSGGPVRGINGGVEGGNERVVQNLQNFPFCPQPPSLLRLLNLLPVDYLGANSATIPRDPRLPQLTTGIPGGIVGGNWGRVNGRRGVGFGGVAGGAVEGGGGLNLQNSVMLYALMRDSCLNHSSDCFGNGYVIYVQFFLIGEISSTSCVAQSKTIGEPACHHGSAVRGSFDLRQKGGGLRSRCYEFRHDPKMLGTAGGTLNLPACPRVKKLPLIHCARSLRILSQSDAAAGEQVGALSLYLVCVTVRSRCDIGNLSARQAVRADGGQMVNGDERKDREPGSQQEVRYFEGQKSTVWRLRTTYELSFNSMRA
nr:Retrovirus-related Pol polyprotein from transposon TNT 1-94 [Ipomoea batatas]